MSIRIKLLFLIFITIISFTLLVAAYFIFISPISKIEKEKAILTELRSSLLNEQIQLNKITTLRFEQQVQTFKDAIEQTKTSFEKLDSLVILPEANQTIKEAISAIRNLLTFKESWTIDFLYNVKIVLSDAAEIFSFTNTFTLPELLTSKRTFESESFDRIADDINNFTTGIQSLSETIGSAVDTIDTQFAIIQSEIDAIRFRSNI